MKVSPEIEKIINKLNESKGNITNKFGTINNVQIINQELNKIINNMTSNGEMDKLLIEDLENLKTRVRGLEDEINEDMWK